MTPETISALVNMGSAGAVIAVVVIFLRHLKERDAAWQAFFVAERQVNQTETDKMCESLDHLALVGQQTYDLLKSHDDRVPALINATEARVTTAVNRRSTDKETEGK